MITFEKYKNSFELFSRMDLDLSWVYFSKKKVKIGGISHDVVLLQVKQHPHKIIRLIQRVFQFLFGGNRHLEVAKNLLFSIEQITRLSSQTHSIDYDLIEKTGKVASTILQKLKRANPSHKSQIEQYTRRIQNEIEYSRSSPVAHRDPFLVLQPNSNLFFAVRSNPPSESHPRPSSSFPELHFEPPSFAARHFSPPETSLTEEELRICEESDRVGSFCEQSGLQYPTCFDVVHSVDWTKDDPVLFDLTYFMKLAKSEELHSDLDFSALKSEITWTMLRNQRRHLLSRGQNPNKDTNYQNSLKQYQDFQTLLEYTDKFKSFLLQLVNTNRVRDKYKNLLTIENTDRIRQMTLAVLNTLNSKRPQESAYRDPSDFRKANSEFKNLYAAVIIQFGDALEHCTNGVNTRIENIYMGLTYPNEGDLSMRVKLALQSLRNTIFQQAILTCIQKSPKPEYYMEHEAATVNYYRRILSMRIGLPASISAFDSGYQAYALMEQESHILDLFFQSYNFHEILEKVREKINNPENTEIPTQFFTEWVEKWVDKRNEDIHSTIDSNGHYKAEIVIELLKEIGILRQDWA